MRTSFLFGIVTNIPFILVPMQYYVCIRVINVAVAENIMLREKGNAYSKI